MLVLISLWNQLNVDANYQRFYKSSVACGQITSHEINSEISHIRNALAPTTKKRWPFSPSERYREAQQLFSNLDTFWEIYRVDPSHRADFRATHRDLDNETLSQIWREHETFRRLTLPERSRCSELSERAQVGDPLHLHADL